jgi:hypothetical protein
MFEISCQKGRTAWHRASHVTRRPDPSRTGSGVAVKIIVFGNQNIFKDRKNSSQGVTPVPRIAPLCNFLQSIKSYFSPYGCQRADDCF